MDDCGRKIELAQLQRPAEIVKSDEFPVITGLRLPPPRRSTVQSHPLLSTGS
jgi:hypothetical protein